jgi:hypothetical protein
MAKILLLLFNLLILGVVTATPILPTRSGKPLKRLTLAELIGKDMNVTVRAIPGGEHPKANLTMAHEFSKIVLDKNTKVDPLGRPVPVAKNTTLTKRQTTSCSECDVYVSGYTAMLNYMVLDEYAPYNIGTGASDEIYGYLETIANGNAPECSSTSSYTENNGFWYDLCTTSQYIGTQPYTGNWIYVGGCTGNPWYPDVMYVNYYWGSPYAACWPSDGGNWCNDDSDIIRTWQNYAIAWCDQW